MYFIYKVRDSTTDVKRSDAVCNTNAWYMQKQYLFWQIIVLLKYLHGSELKKKKYIYIYIFQFSFLLCIMHDFKYIIII